MKKEIISLDGIKGDLCGVIGFYTYITQERFLSVACPLSAMAVAFGIMAKNNLPLGLLCIAVCLIPIAISAVFHIPKLLRWRRLKKTVQSMRGRGELLISVERLDYIKRETVYEPRIGRKSVHHMKEASFYYFVSGKRWRRIIQRKFTPWVTVPIRYYEWSRDFVLSPMGLDNVSLEGDEFLYVCLRDEPEVACIYPAKYFKLDESV